jgi:ABC-2 type transport system ATP-binding protein
LAHRIVVVDHGRVIADGTPLELKEASRSAHVEVMLAATSFDTVSTAVAALQPLVAGEVHVSDDGRQLSAGVDASTGLATAVVRALDAAGVLVDNIEVRQPSLDDVFFSLTGGHIVEEVEDGAAEGVDDGGDGPAGGDGPGGKRATGADPATGEDGRHELEGVRA